MTSEAQEFRLVELARRLANVIRPGVIAEVDYRGELVRVRFAEAPPPLPRGEGRGAGRAAITDWLPWMTSRAGGDASWWAPEVGEQVLLLSPSGDLANAVALPALYSTARPAPSNDPDKRLVRYSDGAEIEYDRANHRLRAVLPMGGAAEITAPDGVTVTGDLTVTGGVDATGDITADGNIEADGNVEAGGEVSDSRSSMRAMRTTYNGHVHGVPPGVVTPVVAPTHRMT